MGLYEIDQGWSITWVLGPHCRLNDLGPNAAVRDVNGNCRFMLTQDVGLKLAGEAVSLAIMRTVSIKMYDAKS